MTYKKYKKYFSGLLILTLLLQIFTVSSSVSAAKYDDVSDQSLTEMINVLGALNIWGDEGTTASFNPKGNLTRREYCDIIIRLLNINDVTVADYTTYFNDIESGNPQTASIQTLYALGYLNSYTDGSFQPDEPIKTGQAISILCSALGYNVYSANGSSYMSLAASKGLIRGVSASEASNFSREMVVRLIYNALSADYIEQTMFGNKNEYNKSKNVLEARHKIFKRTGKVSANSFTTLSGESTLNNGTVIINGIAYDAGDTLASEFLGYNVTFYVKEIEDFDKMLIVYIGKGVQNNELVVKSEYIEPSTTAKSVVYYLSDKKDKTLKAKISPTADVIYNGVATKIYSDSDFRPSEGEVRLLDADGDHTYETVFITSYKIYVVSMVDLKNDIIYDKYGNSPLRLYFNNYVIEKDGAPKKIVEINTLNILSVAESKGPEHSRKVTINISSSTVFGKISEIDDDGVIIDGILYKYSPSCQRIAEMGTVATFYLTFDGKIIDYDTKNTPQDAVYAYMIGASQGVNLGDKLKFKLFELNGKINIYEGTDKIFVDGVSVRDKAALIEALTWGKIANLVAIDYSNLGSINFANYNDGEVHQLVKVKFNENMEVNYIDTAFRNPQESDESLKNQGVNANYKYKSWERVFGLKYPVGTNTVFISVPTDKSREKNYAIKNSGAYVNDKDYSFMVYDVDEFNIPAIMMEENIASLNANINSVIPMSLVTRVGMVLDEDDQMVKRVYVRSLKENTYVDAVNDYADADVKKGDLIRYEQNELKQMIAYEKVLDLDDDDPNAVIKPSAGVYKYLTNNGIWNEHGVLYGKILKKNVEEGVIMMQVPNDPALYVFRVRDATSCNQYFKSTGTNAPATLADIIDVASGGIDGASDVLLPIRYAAPGPMVIFKK